MKPLNEIYGKRFFARRYKLHWRAPYVCGAINNILEPKSVIDVGCATGDLVDAWLNRYGIKAEGIEGDESAREFAITDHITFADLRVRLLFPPKQWDLCTCFEVVEHIEPEYVDELVHNLTNFSDTILISAAPPGQGGLHHVNCQPFAYWTLKFRNLGYIYDEIGTVGIKQGMAPWRKKDGIRAFYNNLMLFRKVK